MVEYELMSRKNIKVAVALSGGVDSGVAAALLVKAGYRVAGFHMHLWTEEVQRYKGTKVQSFENKCCSTESLEAARKTAHRLGIPFYIVDFEKVFKAKVVDYFLKEYAAGRTPNPCVVCNRFIKFGELFDYAKMLGYEYLATGHYSRVAAELKSQNSNLKTTIQNAKIYHLLTAKDKGKDQSYFLYNLTQEKLAHVMFPVGDYLKKEVRAMAEKWRLPVAERPESQEICFFPESDYRPFLKRQIPDKLVPGEVVDTKGRVIGQHQGLPLYTIGQRHGFTKSYQLKAKSSNLIPPYYVIGKDSKTNCLIVGFGKETERKEFLVKDVNWLLPLDARRYPLNAEVRIRHQGVFLGAEVQRYKGTKRVRVVLDEPQRGIAPGQAAVFYREVQRYNGTKVQSKNRKETLYLCTSEPLDLYEVLGGGIISS
jgi:tRNA-specific 2-thiouridylase